VSEESFSQTKDLNTTYIFNSENLIYLILLKLAFTFKDLETGLRQFD